MLLVSLLKCLQNAAIFNPRWPNIGPKGGAAVAICALIKVDMHKATLQEGKNRILKVSHLYKA